MDMDRSAAKSPSEHKATRSVFVFWIVLNNFSTQYCLADFVDANIPNDALVDSVFRILEIPVGNLSSDFGYHFPRN